ncbi:MAG TPA: hypothetical protein ENH82_12590 [bacterium]|nr:hypothetical protein [bacterium]
MTPADKVKGDNVVCILYENSKFKDQVIENIKKSIVGKGYEAVTDKRKKSKLYNSADYGAVVYLTKYRVWHTPLHTKRYFKKNNNAENIIFMVTAGDPNVTIIKPFDAVTSASNPDSVERVTREILDRLDGILKK